MNNEEVIMRRKKKLLTMVLCAALTAGILTGCGSTGRSTEPEGSPEIGSTQESTAGEEANAAQEESTAEHIEITMAVWNIEKAFSDANDKVLQEIQEKLNITLTPVNISWDDYTEKIQLWAASDSLPDIFVGDIRTTSNFYTWATQGLLKEIPQDFSKYPNLSAYMDSPELNTCQVDGKTYCIFRQTFGEQSATARNTCIAYRWDLAQKAGITKEPENWDEFREMIQAIIMADPDNNNVQGATALGYDRLVGAVLPYSLSLGCAEGTSFYWSDKGDGTYIPSYFAGETLGANALPALQLLRDMYEEGTIEKDIALTTTTQAHEKFLNGQSAAIIVDGFGGAYDDTGAYWQEVYGRDFFEDVKSLDIMPDINGQPAYPIADYAWSESFINASVDDEKLDRILQLYDYLLSDEGAFLGTYGYEGETFEFDENGAVRLHEGVLPSEVYPSTDVFSILVRWNPNTYDKRFPAGSIAPNECTKADNRRQEEARNFEIPEYDYAYTTAFISLGNGFSLNVKDDLLNIATGTKPVEDMWNEIIEGYKAKGLEDVIQQVNASVQK